MAEVMDQAWHALFHLIDALERTGPVTDYQREALADAEKALYNLGTALGDDH